MAVTRSWTLAGPASVMVRVERRKASAKLAWLVAASLMVAAGLWFVYQAKVQRMSGGPVLNVNAVASPDDLLPVWSSSRIVRNSRRASSITLSARVPCAIRVR